MADYRAIVRLLLDGHSYQQVAAAKHCSKRTVATASQTLAVHGITSLDALENINPHTLASMFPDGRSQRSLEFEQPDFAAVLQRLKLDRNYTLQRAWDTYLKSRGPAGKKKYGYTKFCAHFSDYVSSNDLAATIHHEPGRAMQVDWAGQSLPVTGEVFKAYLFTAVLPYSGMVFVKASLSMNMDAWIDLHAAALEYFGGVPKMLTRGTRDFRTQANSGWRSPKHYPVITAVLSDTRIGASKYVWCTPHDRSNGH